MAWMRTEGSFNSKEERRLHTSSHGLGLFVIAIVVAGVLAMVVTWFLAAYYPIPDDNANYLGILGFLFVLFITVPLAISRFLQGRLLAAIKGSLSIALLGLIAAVTLGSLPLLWRRLTTAMPWIQEIPWSNLLVLWFLADGLWRRRKSTENDHGRSWKGLIFLGSLLILSSMLYLSRGISRFSGGKAWLGALYLAIALLAGLLALDLFAEIWRIWKRRRENPYESIT